MIARGQMVPGGPDAVTPHRPGECRWPQGRWEGLL